MNNNKSKSKEDVYRVGIDARFFGLQNKGLGRYTNELVEWLDEIYKKDKNRKKENKKTDNSINRRVTGKSKNKNKEIEYFIFLRDENFNEYNPQAKNITKIKADYDWYSWEEQIKFPILLNKYKLDLVHFTHFNAPILYSGKFIVTIHDLILFHYPTVKNTTLNKIAYLVKLGAYHLIIRFVVKKADMIIAISKFTKKDIVKSLNVQEDKIKIVYEGAEFGDNKVVTRADKNGEKKEQKKSAIFEKYGIIKEYLLYVGNAYPHKNLERLVLAFSDMTKSRSDDLQLVLVGKKDYFYEKLEKFIKSKNIQNIVITDYVFDEELNNLYDNAKLFVFPSLYEGFGLPPLEALVKNVPVVSSNTSSLPEILGNKVVYFNPKSINSIKDAMINGISDKYKDKILEDREIVDIKRKYNWERMSNEIVELYKSLLNRT